MRQRANRRDVGGHVLARDAITSGRGLDEDAVDIGQRHRHAVHLRLDREAQIVDVVSLEGSGEPFGPRHDLIVIERVVETHHPNCMGHWFKQARRRRTDRLPRARLISQLRVRRL